MAFDFQILTQNGYATLSDISSTCRYVGTVRVNMPSTSGSLAAPSGWTSTTGTYIILGNTTWGYYALSIYASGSTIYYSRPSNSSITYVDMVFFLNKDTTVPGSYGFMARNGSSRVILDSNYKPIVVRNRGTSTSNHLPTNWYTTWYHQVSGTLSTDLEFVQFPVGGIIANFEPGRFASSRYPANHATVSYIRGQMNPSVTTSNPWGLQVRNSAGTLVYDPGLEVIDILAAGVISFGTLKSQGITIPAAATHGFISGPQGATGNWPCAVGIRRQSATYGVWEFCAYANFPPMENIELEPQSNAILSYMFIQA